MATFSTHLRGLPRAPNTESWLEIGVALFAFVFSFNLIGHPDGGALGLDSAALKHTPFESFAAPGWALAAVGMLNVCAATLTLAAHRWARGASMLAGASLVAFLCAHLYWVPGTHLLQLLGLAVGLVIFILSAAGHEPHPVHAFRR